MTKIVFIDFDGTLFSHSTECVPESTKKAIDELRKKGIKVFLCTGRAAVELRQFDLTGVNLDGMVLNNGQIAVDSNNEIIYSRPIEGRLKDVLLDLFHEKRISIYLVLKDDMVLNFINSKIAEVQDSVSSPIPQVGEYSGEDFYMGTAVVQNEQELNEILSLKNIAEVTFWHEGAIDIVPLGMTKSFGIDEVLRIYGIDLSETMAFGDGQNDIDMLKHCQIGIAMGNSTDEVKIVSDYVTDDIDEDGLYNALVHYGLL